MKQEVTLLYTQQKDVFKKIDKTGKAIDKLLEGPYRSKLEWINTIYLEQVYTDSKKGYQRKTKEDAKLAQGELRELYNKILLASLFLLPARISLQGMLNHMENAWPLQLSIKILSEPASRDNRSDISKRFEQQEITYLKESLELAEELRKAQRIFFLIVQAQYSMMSNISQGRAINKTKDILKNIEEELKSDTKTALQEQLWSHFKETLGDLIEFLTDEELGKVLRYYKKLKKIFGGKGADYSPNGAAEVINYILSNIDVFEDLLTDLNWTLEELRQLFEAKYVEISNTYA